VTRVDDQAEVRDFLRTRRARVSPQQAGVIGGGRRRVTGLRREEVATLAGVSTDYYAKMERGTPAGVPPDWSNAVADVGAPGLHFHDLRHTGDALAAGVPGTIIRDLMGRMGHDSIRAALLYLRGSPGADRVIADALPIELQ